MRAFGTVPTRLLLSSSLAVESAHLRKLSRGCAQKDYISRVAAEDAVEGAEVSGRVSSRSSPATGRGTAMRMKAALRKKVSMRPSVNRTMRARFNCCAGVNLGG